MSGTRTLLRREQLDRLGAVLESWLDGLVDEDDVHVLLLAQWWPKLPTGVRTTPADLAALAATWRIELGRAAIAHLDALRATWIDGGWRDWSLRDCDQDAPGELCALCRARLKRWWDVRDAAADALINDVPVAALAQVVAYRGPVTNDDRAAATRVRDRLTTDVPATAGHTTPGENRP